MRFRGKQKLPLRELMAQQYLASMTLFDLSMHDFCLLYVYWRFFITCSFSFAKVVYIKFAEKDRSPECSSWWVGFLPYGLYQRSLLIFGPMSRMECLDISKHNCPAWWTHDLNWTCMTRSEDALGVFWTSYVR